MSTPNSNGPGIPGADTVTRGIDSAADALQDKANSMPGGEKVASAARSAAGAVGTAADYVRENDVKSMLGDFQGLVKRNPGPALLGAAALGFLLSRIFSKN